MIRSAYLRVYVPAGDTVADSAEVIAAERAFVPVGTYGLLAGPLSKGSLTTSWQGNTYVCPAHPRLRMLEGLLAFRNAFPGVTADVLVPEGVAEQAAAELARIRRRDPELRSHILASPWHVPLRWFAAFGPEHKEMVPGRSGMSVRYRSALADAVDRIHRALQILDEAGFSDSVTEQVQDLGDWLATFAAGALIELDYADVAGLFGEGDLLLDESAGDIQASLDALEVGDLDEAGTHYSRVAGRWASAQALTYMN